MLRALAFAAVVFGFAAPAAAQPCQVGRVARLAVDWEDGNRPLVSIGVNGQQILALVDTGATLTTMFRNGAERLGLNLSAMRASARGAGGAVRLMRTRINELSVGGQMARSVDMTVFDQNWPGRQEIGLVLGQNMLSGWDVEFSLAAGEMNFFQTSGDCEETALAYWGDDWTAAPMLPARNPNDHVRAEVIINGQTMVALLDTGAPTSSISLDAARRAGVTPDSPEVIEAGSTGGIGTRRVPTWLGRFTSFQFADEVIRNPQLRIVDYSAPRSRIRHDLLLGADFFRTHRVLFAYSQRRIYFSYLGGRVFQVTGPLDLVDEDEEAEGAAAPAN